MVEMTTISLYKRVPKTNMKNPGMQKSMNGSPSSKQMKIQTRSVREASIVERCAAEAYLVVAIPQQLKQATDKMLPIVSITSHLFSPI